MDKIHGKKLEHLWFYCTQKSLFLIYLNILLFFFLFEIVYFKDKAWNATELLQNGLDGERRIMPGRRCIWQSPQQQRFDKPSCTSTDNNAGAKQFFRWLYNFKSISTFKILRCCYPYGILADQTADIYGSDFCPKKEHTEHAERCQELECMFYIASVKVNNTGTFCCAQFRSQTSHLNRCESTEDQIVHTLKQKEAWIKLWRLLIISIMPLGKH